MNPVMTAFKESPDKGRGLARDMRVRWALEEVCQPYDVRLLTFEQLKAPDHRRIDPFGQIPTYEDGDLALFESGAIVLYLAERHHALLPVDDNGRMRAIMWLFAALNTVEPPIRVREEAIVLESDKPWQDQRLPLLDDAVRLRLGDLAKRLGSAEWLEGEFTVGDLMMVMVLFRLEDGPLLKEFPNLSDYVARGQARPAFKRAFTAQKAVFETGVSDRLME